MLYYLTDVDVFPFDFMTFYRITVKMFWELVTRLGQILDIHVGNWFYA